MGVTSEVVVIRTRVVGFMMILKPMRIRIGGKRGITRGITRGIAGGITRGITRGITKIGAGVVMMFL